MPRGKAKTSCNIKNKVCTKCGCTLSRDSFSRHTKTYDGKRAWCKECAKKDRKNKPSKKKYPYNYAKDIKRKYGIDISDYEKLLATQKGKCAICGSDSRRLVIDHCHQSNKVRGLLCDWCNTGLGFFKDQPELMTAAIAYIKESGA